MTQSMGHRINRNIMECKVVSTLRKHLRSNVLIETLWNVKSVR